MTEKITPERMLELEETALQHGRQASDLLQDPAWQRAVTRAREQAHKDFEGSQPAETAVREEAYYILQALRAVEHQLAREVSAANVATQRRAARAKKEEASSGRTNRRKRA